MLLIYYRKTIYDQGRLPEVCLHWEKIPGLRRFWTVTSTPG